MPKLEVDKLQQSFDDKFGSHNNRKEPVGKHSNYTYEDFLNFMIKYIDELNVDKSIEKDDNVEYNSTKIEARRL